MDIWILTFTVYEEYDFNKYPYTTVIGVYSSYNLAIDEVVRYAKQVYLQLDRWSTHYDNTVITTITKDKFEIQKAILNMNVQIQIRDR